MTPDGGDPMAEQPGQYDDPSDPMAGVPGENDDPNAWPAGPQDEPQEWVQVLVSGAGMHGAASEDSPPLFAFPYGRTLRVVSRYEGWVEVTDPQSATTGWMKSQYLAPPARPACARSKMRSRCTATRTRPAGAGAGCAGMAAASATLSAGRSRATFSRRSATALQKFYSSSTSKQRRT